MKTKWNEESFYPNP